MQTCTPWTVVSRSWLMSLIITFMFEPAKLHMNWASASGTSTARSETPETFPTGLSTAAPRGAGCAARTNS